MIFDLISITSLVDRLARGLVRLNVGGSCRQADKSAG
jgi:hypothetical protein